MIRGFVYGAVFCAVVAGVLAALNPLPVEDPGAIPPIPGAGASDG